LGAIERFRTALAESGIGEDLVRQIFAGHERTSDRSSKEKRAEFMALAMRRMDELLSAEDRHAVRDVCACSKGGWRLKAAQAIAREHAGQSLEARLEALRQVRYMGEPVLNKDGSITAGIGAEGGFPCPCPVFGGRTPAPPVSITYCYCCAGHFRFHYQIALGRSLVTKAVLSSSLESGGTRPCRFVYDIVGE
jgi:hypothetical protein